jgi:heat shock protein beta
MESADDLPLNVSRETLQSNRFLRQLKGIILKRLIQLISKIEEEEPEKFEKIQNVYGSILKLGAVEDTKNREKLTAHTRFPSNQRNVTSLDQYIENKKKGQKQASFFAFRRSNTLSQKYLLCPLDFLSRRDWKGTRSAQG